jgi:hypothetical protein
MKNIKSLSIIFIGLYLVVSFAQADLNINNWSDSIRGFVAIFGSVVSIFVCGYLSLK